MLFRIGGNMYAVIKTGGKQYKVQVGDEIDVELLGKNAGDKVQFAEVLFTHDGKKTQFGAPAIADFFVAGEVVDNVSGNKVTGLKYKRSHNQCRKWGHRQKYSRVKITAIGK